MSTVPQFPYDETPTRPVNDAPTLLRIRRLAELARERLSVAPDDDALALACSDLEAIGALATEALR